MIRAKFRCTSVTRDEHGNEVAQFYAAHGKGNESWSRFTPGGNLTITISNPEAQGRFKPASNYFLDFTEAPPAE